MARARLRGHADHQPAQPAGGRAQLVEIPECAGAVALLGELLEQRVVGIDELLDGFVLEPGGDQLEPNTDALEVGHHPSGHGQALLDRSLQGAVVLEGRDRFARHGVDGHRSDQRLDIHEVGIGRVLGAGARPQHPLHARAFLGERHPPIALQDVLECLVGELGVGDRTCRAELRQLSGISTSEIVYDP